MNFLLIIAAGALVIFAPFIIAWAIAVVFGFPIVITFKSWFAIWFLLLAVGGSRS